MENSSEQSALDFILDDYAGNRVRLLDYQNKLNVYLVFNRGFM